MRPPFLLVLGFVVVGALLAALAPARGGTPASPVVSPWASGGAAYSPAAGRSIPRAVRDATFRFDPAVAPLDQQVVLAAVANARPEAQALVGLIDGLTVIKVGQPAGGAALGTTAPTADGFEVELDLGTASRHLGQRGINRLVLHELGHVVDGALLGDDVRATLDAGIPAGWGCDEGHSGTCAPREERFAEGFAKWATGDIGVNLPGGYKVPPPEPSLEVWGRPLAQLSGAA